MPAGPTPIAIAVVAHHDRFLIGRRAADQTLAGLFEFPGGKQQPGETLAEAAQRECREEAGLEVDVLSEYPSHVQHYAHGIVELHFFACQMRDSSASPRPPYRWVARRELSRYPFPAGNQRLLELLTGQNAADEEEDHHREHGEGKWKSL